MKVYRAFLGALPIAEVEEGCLPRPRLFFFSQEITSRDTVEAAKNEVLSRLPIEVRSHVVWSEHDRSMRYRR
jgi:hypothetical protein